MVAFLDSPGVRETVVSYPLFEQMIAETAPQKHDSYT